MRLDKYIQNFNLLKSIRHYNFSSQEVTTIEQLIFYLDKVKSYDMGKEYFTTFHNLLKFYLLQCIFPHKFISIMDNSQNVFIEKDVKNLPAIVNKDSLIELYDTIRVKTHPIRHKILICKIYLPKELTQYL